MSFAFDAEAFARAARDWLIVNLPAQVDAQAAAHAADDAAEGLQVELVAPDPSRYELGGVGVVTRYPTIEIAVPDFVVGGYDLASRDADVAPSLVVAIWDQHPRHDILYRKMNRLASAVLACLSARGALGDTVIDSVRGAIRFNPETQERDEIVSGAILAFTLASTLQG